MATVFSLHFPTLVTTSWSFTHPIFQFFKANVTKFPTSISEFLHIPSASTPPITFQHETLIGWARLRFRGKSGALFVVQFFT